MNETLTESYNKLFAEFDKIYDQHDDIVLENINMQTKLKNKKKTLNNTTKEYDDIDDRILYYIDNTSTEKKLKNKTIEMKTICETKAKNPNDKTKDAEYVKSANAYLGALKPPFANDFKELYDTQHSGLLTCYEEFKTKDITIGNNIKHLAVDINKDKPFYESLALDAKIKKNIIDDAAKITVA